MWGNRRDWALIKRLRRCLCLEQFRKEKVVGIQEGLIPSETGDLHEGTVGRRFLDADTFPSGTFLYLDAPENSLLPTAFALTEKLTWLPLTCPSLS